MTISEFTIAATTYCMLTSGSQTSGFRTTKHNKDVGGVAFSAHRFGLAWDVVYDEKLDQTVRNAIAFRLGLKLIAEGDHDHLQPFDWIAG